jgi:sodium/hydrogen exchanger 8
MCTFIFAQDAGVGGIDAEPAVNGTDDWTKDSGTLDRETMCAISEEEHHEEVQEEKTHRFTIVLATACLSLTYICGYLLERWHITWFPEAGAGILVGVGAGAIISIVHEAEKVQSLIRFDPGFFFTFLIPPIIFEAGYNMKRQAFFRNLGAVCLYAFFGTTISTFCVGLIVWLGGKLNICFKLSGLASLVFGALISATDPVTVLAVFQKLNANVDLYSLVFGESLLNDAVAIVLYRTLLVFKCNEVSFATVTAGFGSFLAIFIGSLAVGLCFAFMSALIFKHTTMYHEEEFHFLELTLLCTFPYMSFMMAEGLRLSGIVAILFCGVGMAHYTYENLSPHGKEVSRTLFKILASLAETFVFVYLGLAMFTFKNKLNGPQVMLVIVSLVAILFARLFCVYPLSFLANLGRNPNTKPGKINQKFMFVLWFSGLRGAVAFVIAVTSALRNDFPGSDEILTTTLVISIITVFVMGGAITSIINKFDLRQKPTDEDVDEQYITAPSRYNLLAKLTTLDRRVFRPFFTRYEWAPGDDKGHQGTPLNDEEANNAQVLQDEEE